MLRVCKQIAVALVCGVTIFPVLSFAQPAAPAPDPVSTAWKARAAAATKRLATARLDKCDQALELAFQHPNEVNSDTQRNFELLVEIDDQAMVASYSYTGQRLTSFILMALPPGWLAVQNTDSTTLNLLVTASGCSFDLCTNDPFTIGPCLKQQTR